MMQHLWGRTMNAERSTEDEVRELEGVLAYEAANWFDISDSEAEAELKDSVLYLELRGLLIRHAENPKWVSPLDESEATL